MDRRRAIDILGITDAVTIENVRKAYRAAALQCHPDKNLANSEAAKAKFQEISEAYQFLITDNRQEYEEVIDLSELVDPAILEFVQMGAHLINRYFRESAGMTRDDRVNAAFTMMTIVPTRHWVQFGITEIIKRPQRRIHDGLRVDIFAELCMYLEIDPDQEAADPIILETAEGIEVTINMDNKEIVINAAQQECLLRVPIDPFEALYGIDRVVSDFHVIEPGPLSLRQKGHSHYGGRLRPYYVPDMSIWNKPKKQLAKIFSHIDIGTPNDVNKASQT